MESLRKCCPFLIDTITEHGIKKLTKYSSALFDEFRSDWQRYLARKAPRHRVNIKILADGEEARPVFEMVDDPVRPGSQPRLERRAGLPGCADRRANPSKLLRPIQSLSERVRGVESHADGPALAPPPPSLDFFPIYAPWQASLRQGLDVSLQ